MKRPDFPQVIDSTMLAAFRSCPQKMYRMYVEHWKPQGESIHLVAGAAFARGLEVARHKFYAEGCSSDEAIGLGLEGLMLAYGDFQAPEGSAKSLDRMCGALEFYFDRYPLETDTAKPLVLPSGKRAIEFSFATPIEFPHPVSGDPIIYAGRSDMIVTFAEGIYVEDDKTASQLGASWSKQWDLRSQFTGYCWSARQAGLEVNGVLVRGVSILKTKYDTLQAITYRSAWEIDRWYDQVIRDLGRMQGCWERGVWDYNLDHACTEFGGCALTAVCKSPTPKSWLPMYFERRRWDPLERVEEVLS
jgi:hypothetical protein